MRVVSGEAFRSPAEGVDEVLILGDVGRHGVGLGPGFVEPSAALEDDIGTTPCICPEPRLLAVLPTSVTPYLFFTKGVLYCTG